MCSCVLLASDVVDTRVPFEQLAAFPALRDVSLQCNGLRHLSNPDRGFAVLEVRKMRACDTPCSQARWHASLMASAVSLCSQVLDLSVNAVAAEDIRVLAELPCLKELDISRYGDGT